MAFLDKVVLPQNNRATISPIPQSGFLSKIDFQPIAEQPIEKPKELLFRGTFETLAELQIDPLSLKAEPKKVLSSMWEGLKTSVSEGAKKIWNFVGQPLEKKIQPTSEQLGKKLEAVAGLGHIIFSPITAIFEGAKEIPVLGSVARLIELPFSAIGEGGAELGKGVVDKLPISDEAKDNVRQGVEEIFALAGQLAIGKITHIGSKKYNELKTKFGEKDANTIVNKAVELAEIKKAETPVAEVPKEVPKTFLEKAETTKVGVPEVPKVEMLTVIGKEPILRRTPQGYNQILSARSEVDVYKNDVRLYEKYKGFNLEELAKKKQNLIDIAEKQGGSYPSDVRIINGIENYRVIKGGGNLPPSSQPLAQSAQQAISKGISKEEWIKGQLEDYVKSTPEYKQWSVGAKNIQEAYHGTPYSFDKFEIGKKQSGAYDLDSISFATKEANAEPFSRQYPDTYYQAKKILDEKYPNVYKTENNLKIIENNKKIRDIKSIKKEGQVIVDNLNTEWKKDGEWLYNNNYEKFKGRNTYSFSRIEELKNELKRAENVKIPSVSDAEINKLKEYQEKLKELENKTSGNIYKVHIKGNKVINAKGEEIGFSSGRMQEVNEAGKSGYVYIKDADTGQYIGDEIITSNPKNVFIINQEKFKSQLTDFYNLAKQAEVKAPSPLVEVEGIKPSKIALSIEERAIEKKLTEGFEGKAGYDPITIKEQARLVSDLIRTDIEKAKRMIKGEEIIPENLRGGSLLVGLEEFALKKGDVNLLRDLAKSPLVSETSRFGQEIRLLAERSPESPVKIIQDVVKSREAVVEKTTKKKVSQVKNEAINEIKAETKKSASKRPTWEEFVKELKCK